MPHHLDIEFHPLSADPEAVCVAFVADDLAMGKSVKDLDSRAGGNLKKIFAAADFKGKARSSVEIFAPQKLDIARLLVVGVGGKGKNEETDWMMAGGYAMGQVLGRKSTTASFMVDIPDTGDTRPETVAALLAYGALLRRYTFDKYVTRKSENESEPGGDGKTHETGSASNRNGLHKLVIQCADPDKAEAAFERERAVANGVYFARDLVNEPANALGPVEFAERTLALEKAGVDVEVLGVPALSELNMNTLLSVAQGSARPARVVVMQWHGAKQASGGKKKASKPLVFIGKGVVFDTGGISIKPAQGMEDMKGDMGGAACVTGLMLALAERKAAVDAVGIIGCVENMPSGTATRPGDIVVSMSGQTVEILNTDAEGRLVLADLLWYAQQRFKPKLMINLATLTGAIMVALGKEYAGLYVNDDKLAETLMASSRATGEKVWRMPLDKAYDKMIDTKNADMKNIGGRWAGACTAAAFLQRFVKDTPWAHLDIAGTAMDAPRSEINASWGSGWGVRLLDRFVADHHEKGEK